MSQESLKGVFAPLVTPFQDEQIRFDWLEHNLTRLGETPLAGYLALGTNGEFKSLADAERMDVVRTCARLKGDKVLMAGTGCESTRETIELTNRVADVGADFASIICPHYFASRMDDDTLIGFYEEVAEHSRIPVLLYNIPKATANVRISATAAQVLSGHPNIAGMKDSGGASLFVFLTVVEGQFSVLAGSADYFMPGLMLGAAGGVLSLANCFPEACCELYTATISGDLEKARGLHSKYLRANRAVSGTYGVAGVKAAMGLAGYYGGEPRRPLRPLGEQERQAVRRALEELGLLQ